jgi:hypothetical protein
MFNRSGESTLLSMTLTGEALEKLKSTADAAYFHPLFPDFLNNFPLLSKPAVYFEHTA